ncbi:hypothetical protein KJZ67_01835 [Patescibacteria group bacterium]|nr:hypothetical protein [Patescibacteria group bacterium]
MSKYRNKRTFTVDLFTLCDYALFSQDNKLSVMGIFDRIFVRSLPLNHARMVVVASIIGEANSDCKVDLEFVAPNGEAIEKIKPASMNIKLGTNGKGNVITEIVGFPLQEAGEYRVRMLINGESAREIPLYVQKVLVNEGIGKQTN